MVQEYDMRAIGRRLHAAMVEKGITREDFAKSMGVSLWTVGNWINGESRMKLSDAAKACDLLNKPIDWLVQREAANV